MRYCRHQKAIGCAQLLTFRSGSIFGEASCPPCLTCANEDDDFCNICWTEALKAAPCARLKCGHSFHLHCLQKRLEKRWPTARISFDFANCPLCQQRVDHPSLLGAIRVVRALEKKVRDAALERYRAEGLDKAADKSEVVASSSANGKAAASAVPDENALAAAAMRRYIPTGKRRTFPSCLIRD